VLSLILSFSLVHGFWDYVGDKAQDYAEGAAIADATADMAKTFDQSDNLIKDLEEFEKVSSKIEEKLQDTVYISEESKSLMSGVDYSSNRLSSNIRYTTSYFRRLKRLLLRFAALGSDTSTALNTMETVASLSEVQKNQQTMIMMEKQKHMLEINEKLEERKKWDNFLENEHKKRWGVGYD